MSIFEANGIAVNVRYVISVGSVRKAVGGFGFLITIHGRDSINAKFDTDAEAEAERGSLISLMRK